MSKLQEDNQNPVPEYLRTVTRVWDTEQICKSPLMPSHLAINWVLRSQRERGKFQHEGGHYEYWLEQEDGSIYEAK